MSILKDAGNIYEVIRIKGSVTIKVLSMNQYFVTAIWNISLHVTVEFETLQII